MESEYRFDLAPVGHHWREAEPETRDIVADQDPATIEPEKGERESKYTESQGA